MGSENIRSFVCRLATLTLGLAIMATGIVLCIRANLGITPISCPPYVLSLGLSPTVGQFTILMHLVLTAGQWLLLRREFRPVQWLQILPALVFGCFIDGCMWLTSPLVPANYLTCILILLAGNVLLALGIHFEMRPHLILVPTDGFVQALCRRTGLPFSRLKIAFDVSLLLISIACSLILLSIEGIREGTFISAFLVGYLVGLIRKVPF